MIIVVDTETTHYRPELAHVIEIGAYGVDSNGTPQTYEELCNPGIDLRGCEQALKINGIKEKDVYSARPIEKVAIDFWIWLFQFGHVEFAGFNSDNYDAPILSRGPWDIPSHMWKYDVMKMAIAPMDKAGLLPHHPYYHTPKWPKLSETEKFFRINRDGFSHRALSDAKATWDILQILLYGRDDE